MMAHIAALSTGSDAAIIYLRSLHISGDGGDDRDPAERSRLARHGGQGNQGYRREGDQRYRYEGVSPVWSAAMTDRTEHESTLFRGNSFATRIVTLYGRSQAYSYLRCKQVGVCAGQLSDGAARRHADGPSCQPLSQAPRVSLRPRPPHDRRRGRRGHAQPGTRHRSLSRRYLHHLAAYAWVRRLCAI